VRSRIQGNGGKNQYATSRLPAASERSPDHDDFDNANWDLNAARIELDEARDRVRSRMHGAPI